MFFCFAFAVRPDSEGSLYQSVVHLASGQHFHAPLLEPMSKVTCGGLLPSATGRSDEYPEDYRRVFCFLPLQCQSVVQWLIRHLVCHV
jgi:hypothetical protein